MDAPSSPTDRRSLLSSACRSLGVAAVYLFGSRADDGVRLLDGGSMPRAGSDLDVGVLLDKVGDEAHRLARLQVTLEDVFAPLPVDLVPLDRVDGLFQFRAIDGHRVYAPDDAGVIDRWELVVMRRAADLLPIQRRIERDLFGVATS